MLLWPCLVAVEPLLWPLLGVEPLLRLSLAAVEALLRPCLEAGAVLLWLLLGVEVLLRCCWGVEALLRCCL